MWNKIGLLSHAEVLLLHIENSASLTTQPRKNSDLPFPHAISFTLETKSCLVSATTDGMERNSMIKRGYFLCQNLWWLWWWWSWHDSSFSTLHTYKKCVLFLSFYKKTWKNLLQYNNSPHTKKTCSDIQLLELRECETVQTRIYTPLWS